MQVDGVLDDRAGAPFNGVAGEIATVGGTETEVLVSGVATGYRMRSRANYSPDGRWDAAPAASAPFRTRLLIERPTDPDACNGSVVLCWNNVSAGQDLFLTPSQVVPLVQDGFVVIGVSAQRVGVHGWDDVTAPQAGLDVPAGLCEWNPGRYGELEHPGDAYSYDIFTQAAELVRSGLLPEIDVDHVIAMGASQSASRLATYVNAIQPQTSALDGFVILVYHGFGAVLDPHEQSAGGIPEMGLLAPGLHRLRDDLTAPTLVVNSEFEAARFDANWQEDAARLRWWEFAGAAHCGLQARTDLQAMLAGLPGVDLDRLNYVCFLPAIRAGAHAVRRWIAEGIAPPAQPRLEKTGTPPRLPRDEHGNAIGGIRTPEVEAPLATYVGALDPADPMNQMGVMTPFTPEKIRELYRDRSEWLSRYEAAANRLVDAAVFLPEDAARQVARAAAEPFPGVASPV